jgi:hypothetical protein
MAVGACGVRLPSDAQATVLACVQEHDRNGEQVYAGTSGGSRVGLYVERTTAELHPSSVPPAVLMPQPDAGDVLLPYAGVKEVRLATLQACVRHGWLDTVRTRAITTKCIGVAWRPAGNPWDATVSVVDLTEDGTIALGAWRQRRLAAPVETLSLAPADRELLELAERANRLGFVLLPGTDQAKREARRLARGPFAQRGWGAGVGTRSLEPTALGVVEVNPAVADERECAA